MGRAGGGGGGGHHSGGGHSNSHSSGGHHVGGGRAGGSGGHAGGGGPRRYHGGPPPRMYHPFGTRGSLYFEGGPLGCLSTIVILLVFCVVIATSVIIPAVRDSFSCRSTIVREKLDSENSYINDCVVDELGWFDNVSWTEAELKSFWEKTGVQPYIVLKDYDSALTTDEEKEQWALDYYDENLSSQGREDVFLYVYFAEVDADNDVGYMCYVNGTQVSSIMDSEAVEIFWNYVDRYWYSDLSTDEVFVQTFSRTAKTIMRVSTTFKDVAKLALIVIAVIVLGVVVIVLVNKHIKRKREEAAETQRILNTPIDDMVDDDLTNRYL